MNQPLDAALLRRMSGLLRLAQLSAEAAADAWQCAVPIDVLRNHNGLSNDDLHWLVAERLAEHRLETTHNGSRKRTFRKSSALKLAAATCFVISPKGLHLARRVCLALQPTAGPAKPEWDAATGNWTYEGRLIKHLRDDADAQRAVLDQCQAENWEDEITSPFLDMPPNERSHYLGRVLHRLNTGDKEARVKLSSRKKGRCICWRVLEGKHA